ncbi:MAG: gluconate 2-dehydrogenase subunit 3 family protein [Myxococcota bacterium]
MAQDDARAGGLTDIERRTLEAVLNEIIPPSNDPRMPGAGDLGVAASIEERLCETPGLRPGIAQGLADVDGLARERGAVPFAELPRDVRAEVLRELGDRAAAFLPTLIFLAYAAYYQNPRVLTALGLEPRPPFPDGYEVPSTDLSILDPVRRRPAIYRKTPS